MILDEEEVKAKQIEEEKKKMSISLSGEIPNGEKGTTTKLIFLFIFEYKFPQNENNFKMHNYFIFYFLYQRKNTLDQNLVNLLGVCVMLGDYRASDLQE